MEEGEWKDKEMGTPPGRDFADTCEHLSALRARPVGGRLAEEMREAISLPRDMRMTTFPVSGHLAGADRLLREFRDRLRSSSWNCP